jgi:hypothetical protein
MGQRELYIAIRCHNIDKENRLPCGHLIVLLYLRESTKYFPENALVFAAGFLVT